MKTDLAAYAHFVDYTCFVTTMPFADSDLLPAFLDFFTTWMGMAEQRMKEES